MVRVCKMTLATLEATLACFVDGSWKTALPFYAMLSLSREELETRCAKITALLRPEIAAKTTIEDSLSYIGSGSAPDEGLPSRVLAITVPGDPEALAQRLKVG
jgi:L-seryl-tRNA(Ser) seleniumtransferase